jgi:hypothetical protein
VTLDESGLKNTSPICEYAGEETPKINMVKTVKIDNTVLFIGKSPKLLNRSFFQSTIICELKIVL